MNQQMYALHVLFFQWDPNAPQSLGSFCDHQHVVYSAVWSPHISGTFASVSGNWFYVHFVIYLGYI